ncbi:MAG: Cache 3/Cache 2 fusion domain-containing protein [Sphaerochaeta sp.]|nr:Cache 3/Cache 2 fusion domain-containing protein [Sphaerochaeta sp.]
MVDANLDTSSALITKIVETSIENKRGEIPKDVIVAQHYIGEDISLDRLTVKNLRIYNPVRETYFEMDVPSLFIAGQDVSTDHGVVDQISEKTAGVVSLYVLTDKGFVCVSSSDRNTEVFQGIGWLIPTNSPIYTLLMREGTWYGRDYDYIDKEWVFTGYQLLYERGEVIGATYVSQDQVQMDSLREQLLSIPVGKKGVPYIVDYIGRVVVHPEDEGKQLMDYADIVNLVFQRNGRIQYTQMDNETGRPTKHLAFFKYISEMNWIVIVGSTVHDLYGSLYAIRLIFIIIFGISLVVAQVLGIFLGRRIAKPITQITKKIWDLSEGEANLSSSLEVYSNDEVGRLAEYFNTFVKKLKNLNDLERHGIDIMLRDTQMNALQAQINPHFLYNTLETIRFMITQKDERAVEMVKLLAKLFRISIGEGESYVTLRKELEHAQLYINLQQYRYSDRFSVIYDIEEPLLDLYTLKFILQPIVENSIIHAFDHMGYDGVITISAHAMEGKILVSVQDNGQGMDRLTLDRVHSNLRESSKINSVGLRNVHDRILLNFGSEYYLKIESNDEGTEVLMLLPYLTLKPKSTYISENSKPVFIY